MALADKIPHRVECCCPVLTLSPVQPITPLGFCGFYLVLAWHKRCFLSSHAPKSVLNLGCRLSFTLWQRAVCIEQWFSIYGSCSTFGKPLSPKIFMSWFLKVAKLQSWYYFMVGGHHNMKNYVTVAPLGRLRPMVWRATRQEVSDKGTTAHQCKQTVVQLASRLSYLDSHFSLQNKLKSPPS